MLWHNIALSHTGHIDHNKCHWHREKCHIIIKHSLGDPTQSAARKFNLKLSVKTKFPRENIDQEFFHSFEQRDSIKFANTLKIQEFFTFLTKFFEIFMECVRCLFQLLKA